ncbi:MAG: hypothetical protein AAGI38_17585 [Bacteroidota bacterium]
MSFSESTQKFEINEFELQDTTNTANSDVHRMEHRQENGRTYTRRRRKIKSTRTKKNKPAHYGWAFFLCSMFIGLGITATTDAPIGLFMGLGIGFLFFVDPIYRKVMNIIDRL